MDFLSANSRFAVQNDGTYLPRIMRETCTLINYWNQPHSVLDNRFHCWLVSGLTNYMLLGKWWATARRRQPSTPRTCWRSDSLDKRRRDHQATRKWPFCSSMNSTCSGIGLSLQLELFLDLLVSSLFLTELKRLALTCSRVYNQYCPAASRQLCLSSILAIW